LHIKSNVFAVSKHREMFFVPSRILYACLFAAIRIKRNPVAAKSLPNLRHLSAYSSNTHQERHHVE